MLLRDILYNFIHEQHPYQAIDDMTVENINCSDTPWQHMSFIIVISCLMLHKPVCMQGISGHSSDGAEWRWDGPHSWAPLGTEARHWCGDNSSGRHDSLYDSCHSCHSMYTEAGHWCGDNSSGSRQQQRRGRAGPQMTAHCSSLHHQRADKWSTQQSGGDIFVYFLICHQCKIGTLLTQWRQLSDVFKAWSCACKPTIRDNYTLTAVKSAEFELTLNSEQWTLDSENKRERASEREWDTLILTENYLL